MRLETASAWFVGAAKKMYGEKRIWGPRGDDSWDKNAGAPGRGGELWDGNDGYDPGRWELWKKSWEGVVKGEGKQEGQNVVEAAKVCDHWSCVVFKATHDVVQAALNAMAKAEN